MDCGIKAGNKLRAESTTTSWLNVFVLIGAGAAVALQVGKVPAALPALQEDLGLSLVESGWVLAIFSLIAAGFGAFLGSLADRYGRLFVALFGMVLTAVSGIVGGFSPNGAVLLATRTFEGLGFILTSVSIPPLIALAASERNRRATLALWGSYMPVGSGIMLVAAGPLLYFFDWRILWWVTAFMILTFSVIVYRVGRTITVSDNVDVARPKFSEVVKLMRSPGPLLLSMIFVFYAGQYMILAGFLPLILVENNGYTLLLAAFVMAIVVLFNAGGNAMSGWLLNRGAKPVTLIITGCIAMSVGGAIAFLEDVPGWVRILAAAVFTGFGGLIPGSLFAQVPHHAPRQSLMASVNGMLVQGAALGQLVGPPVAAAFVAGSANWQAAIPVLMAGALITAAGAVALSFIENR